MILPLLLILAQPPADFKTPIKIYMSFNIMDGVSTEWFLPHYREINPFGQTLKSRVLLLMGQTAVLSAADYFFQEKHPKVIKFIRYLFMFLKTMAISNNITLGIMGRLK